MKYLVGVANQLMWSSTNVTIKNNVQEVKEWLIEQNIDFTISETSFSIPGGANFVVDEEIALAIKLRWGDLTNVSISPMASGEQALSGAS